MKKITILLAAIGVAASTVSFAQENDEYITHSHPFADLDNGGVVVGTLDHLCWELSRQYDTPNHRHTDARFNNFTKSDEGANVRPLVCDIKGEHLRWVNGEVIWYPANGGNWSTAGAYGPAKCIAGGLYSNLPEPYDINVCHEKK